ncbi:MAG: hypothetical protein KatS3mg090_0989 [Patescibacteria group bacterium]|nr:MAG: hypothetical protein KatS3mg090_0702 [Patescibacteria group bacterium]GIW63141.1 MAG: hypothetical protein KatS3mg090_0967 [Patescibacteria group bacterium]GIW63163.1 MAG: hypothetical protein KatS3mg090_0989 [Patescibacteria group bacterium]
MITFLVLSENKPGVLYRIADVFLKRKINIQSLTVAEIDKNLSRFTITAYCDNANVEKVEKNLYKIIEVVKVTSAYDQELIFKELVIVKVNSASPYAIRDLDDLIYLHKAEIVYTTESAVYIEKQGTEDDINSFLNSVRPYGIKEIVRSGRIGLLKPKNDKKTVDFSLNCPDYIEMLDVSAIKKIEYYSKEFKDVVSLAQGTPASATDKAIREAAKYAIDKGLVDKYTSGYGIDQLRELLVKKLKHENNLPNINKNNIIVTHGAAEGLMAIFLALFRRNDEIVVITPDYASHLTQIRISRKGGRPVFLPMQIKNGGWSFSLDKLESIITVNTKAILICNPSNPTGKVYSREELEGILEIAQKYNLLVITDEIYEKFVYGKKQHISFASLSNAFERTISIFGFSKSFSMTGWRIGYIVADESIIKNIFKVHDALITCPTAVSQYAAIAALENSDRIVQRLKEEYEEKRKLCISLLKDNPKIEFAHPDGAYYLFFKIKGVDDDFKFALRLIEEAGVAIVPGSAFGLGGEGFFRIAFCRERESIIEGIERLNNYLKKIRL